MTNQEISAEIWKIMERLKERAYKDDEPAGIIIHDALQALLKLKARAVGDHPPQRHGHGICSRA